MLYYKWDTPRAYFVERPILERYLNAGGPNGALGFPTGDPVLDQDPRNGHPNVRAWPDFSKGQTIRSDGADK